MSLVVKTLSDQLVTLVRDRILSGRVAANAPIRQDALAAELGISKIPLREALARLEQEGLIQSQANRGFFVRDLTTPEAEEVYALRLKLEPETVVAAAEHATDAERTEAEQALGRLQAAMASDEQGVTALNRAFHLALLRPSGQPITCTILERLHVLSERYVRKHLEPSGRETRADSEHREILGAWLARDGAAVRHLTERHIQGTLDDLREQLQAA